MTQRNVKCKLVLAVVAVVVLALLWLFRRPVTPAYKHVTCDQLFAKVHKHIVPGAFERRQETFVGMWASAGALEVESCSYYSFHKREKNLILGYQKLDGNRSTKTVAYSEREDGVIRYFRQDEPTKTLGYLYPVFFDDYLPALGNVQCSDKYGFVKWKATIAVPLMVIQHPEAEDIIRLGVEGLQRVASEIGVDIGTGDYYKKPCWQPPMWKLGKPTGTTT